MIASAAVLLLRAGIILAFGLRADWPYCLDVGCPCGRPHIVWTDSGGALTAYTLSPVLAWHVTAVDSVTTLAMRGQR